MEEAVTGHNGCSRARSRSASVASYEVGEIVDYWSTSAGRWIAAKVLKVNAEEGQCDLDLKPGAQLGRLRKSAGLRPARTEHTGTTWPKSGTKGSSLAPPPPLSCGFKENDQVQYWSETKSRWLEAVVLQIREKDGAIVYDLDCKRGTAADRVRPSLVVSQKQFEIGTDVEYWSTSAGRWLPAKVLRLYEHLSICDLDVKPGAPLGRMRHATTTTVPSAASASTSAADTADANGNSPTSSRDPGSNDAGGDVTPMVPTEIVPQPAAEVGAEEEEVEEAKEPQDTTNGQPPCVGEWCSGEKMMRIVENSGRLVVDMGPLTPKLALVTLASDEVQTWPRRWTAIRKCSGNKAPPQLECSKPLYILELPSASSPTLLVKRPVGEGQVEFMRVSNGTSRQPKQQQQQQQQQQQKRPPPTEGLNGSGRKATADSQNAPRADPPRSRSPRPKRRS